MAGAMAFDPFLAVEIGESGIAIEIGIFTQALPERYLRLEGINTAQGNAKVLVELYRVAFDPLKEISALYGL